MLTGQAVS